MLLLEEIWETLCHHFVRNVGCKALQLHGFPGYHLCRDVLGLWAAGELPWGIHSSAPKSCDGAGTASVGCRWWGQQQRDVACGSLCPLEELKFGICMEIEHLLQVPWRAAPAWITSIQASFDIFTYKISEFFRFHCIQLSILLFSCIFIE